MEKQLTWGDLLKERDVVLFCTATTGLKPPDAKCIGLWYANINDGSIKRDCIVQQLNEDELSQGAAYHKIPTDVVSRRGLDKKKFDIAISNFFAENRLYLTYNRKFQLQWFDPLPHMAYSLPGVLQTAEARYFLELETLNFENAVKEASAKIYNPKSPGFSAFLERYGAPEATEELPVEKNLTGLLFLYQKLLGITLPVLQVQ